MEEMNEKEDIIQSEMELIRKCIKKDLRKYAREIASLIKKTSNMYYFEGVFKEELTKELEKIRKKNK